MTKPTSKNASELPPAPIVLTAGEPAGIGPELCLALADTEFADKTVIVADVENLRLRAQRLGRECALEIVDPERPAAASSGLRVWPLNLPNPDVCGQPDPANSTALLGGLREAIQGCQNGTFSALVTAPLQKSAIIDAGIAFTGHTEFLAEATGASLPVMLLVAGTLRVALVTTHLPLSSVSSHITEERVRATLRVLHDDLKRHFAIRAPRIVVCGLNPHAGEAGHLGHEDDQVIAPAIAASRRESIDVRGPVPADTAFTPAAGPADAIVAMYHDQGLPVLKYASFGKAVNVTLGLPIVRTSVDHGTALDIAGQGRADAGSFLAAIEMAAAIAGR